MSDLCDDNRFELIEKYKKELIEATNIETSPEEMNVFDNILFRFWQMGWLDSIDRMPLVKESAKTLMHSGGDSVFAKALRNAGRFIQNAIDGEAPEYEKIPSAQTERKTGRWIYGEHDVAMCDGYRCDKCGFFVPWDYQHKFKDFIKDYHFCPNCGLPMIGGERDENH